MVHVQTTYVVAAIVHPILPAYHQPTVTLTVTARVAPKATAVITRAAAGPEGRNKWIVPIS
jgi:hypothetical protein